MIDSIALLLSLAGTATAYFPKEPTGITLLKSKYHENVTISYKEPGICETTPGVKSYSGYVHLPPSLLSDIAGETQDYPINTFFWFFEARKDPETAPLSIWLNGGPGGSSAMGLLQENGPCFIGNDSNSTYLNPWSWNNEVNMLYLDQPTQVGFSYDVITNGTYNASSRVITPTDFSEGFPTPNNTYMVGTFSSQNGNFTANSTIHAAHALWHFAQTWFEEFPFYKPTDEKIHLWTESYGGIYGPNFFSFFQQQNEKIANGTISEPGSHYLHLDTLGIVNGCIDYEIMQLAYLDMAYNNTYDIKAINESVYNTGIEHYYKQGGCKDQVKHCRHFINDENNDPFSDEADKICGGSMEYCAEHCSESLYSGAEIRRGRYDIAHPRSDPFPAPYLYGFLNQQWVQAALGVPVNHTASSRTVATDFRTTGDYARGTSLKSLAYLLDGGVKVAGMYGDRDWACNWIGGERAVHAVDYSSKEQFKNAGYEPIIYGANNDIGGNVKQFGNFSFSRVYQAGHEVPSYQGEVSYEIFMRATFGKDITTGIYDVTDYYTTIGPSSVFNIKNEVPDWPESKCYILAPDTCTAEQYEQVLNGTVKVKDFIVTEYGVKVDQEEGMKGEEVVTIVAQKPFGHWLAQDW
ncbi:Alpha/Beta hydrolase protein [Bisporella sp. PMI_857]|nr:Alpha/Beta hydrolase protein [Bisporella sp. PMI_857]